jgi:hypothetical protein
VSPGERQRGPGEKEGHIAAEPRRELEQLVPGDGMSGECVGGDKCRRRVARTAAQPGAHGDALGDPQVHAEPVARGIEDEARRPNRKVVGRRPEIGCRACVERHARLGRSHGLDLVGQTYAAEQRLDAVEPVGLPCEDAEEQVHLGRRRDRDRGAHADDASLRRSRRLSEVVSSDQPPSSTIGMKVVT